MCVCVCVRCRHSRLRLHEGHAGGLVAVGVQRGHHLPGDRVEHGQGGQRPGDLPALRHAPQLLGGLLDGAVVNHLDAGGGTQHSGLRLALNPHSSLRLALNPHRGLRLALNPHRVLREVLEVHLICNHRPGGGHFGRCVFSFRDLGVLFHGVVGRVVKLALDIFHPLGFCL